MCRYDRLKSRILRTGTSYRVSGSNSKGTTRHYKNKIDLHPCQCLRALEQAYEVFGEFQSFFAPLFGHRESRDLSQNYLRALLVQSPDRRNAENFSESVGVSLRAMQRFHHSGPVVR